MPNTGGPCHIVRAECFLSGLAFPVGELKRVGFKEVTLTENGSRKETGAWVIGWIRNVWGSASLLAEKDVVCERHDGKLYKVEV